MTDRGCAGFQQLSAELALGILQGRERAEALAHVAQCPACQQDLMDLGVVADRLSELVPSAEPPAGFETRVIGRISASPPVPSPPSPSRRGRLPGVRLALAAVLAVLFAVGGWALGHHHVGGTPTADLRTGNVRTASFLVGGRSAGQVVAYGGSHPWVGVAVDSDLGNQTIRCQLLEGDGHTMTVGRFALTGGHGYWGAPIGVKPSSLRRVELVNSQGRAVAVAIFGHHQATST